MTIIDKKRFFVSMVLSAIVLTYRPAVAQAPGKRLQVVILSVSEFTPQFQSPLLERGIQNATNNLESFFKSRFPSANLTVLTSSTDTSSTNLTEFFRGRLRDIVNGNVTLLFILSHGEVYPYPDSRYGFDLHIIASDTQGSGDREHSISLSEDILPRLNGLSPGSLIFGFIDTCYSSAAVNFSIGLDDAVRNKLGVKTMLMASALSDQLMVQAGFTQALVNLWSGPSSSNCTVPELSSESIRDEIKRILANTNTPLGETEGWPTVLIHFQGPFCIESFAEDSALVTIYNATANSYLAVFEDAAGRAFHQIVQGNDTTPVRLARTRYEMSLFRNNQKVSKPKTIDLTTDALDYEVIGTPNDVARVGRSLEDSVLAGEAIGLPEHRLNQLRKAAYVAYVIAKDETRSNALASVLDKSDDGEWHAARELGSKSAGEIWASVSTDDPVALAKLAQQLSSVGNLEQAAGLYRAAAARTDKSDSEQKHALARDAYVSYSAAGEHSTAQEVQHKFKVQADDVCDGCKDLGKMAAKGNEAASDEIKRATGSMVVVGLAEGSSKSAASTQQH